jgi:hypothetical protein
MYDRVATFVLWSHRFLRQSVLKSLAKISLSLFLIFSLKERGRDKRFVLRLRQSAFAKLFKSGVRASVPLG